MGSLKNCPQRILLRPFITEKAAISSSHGNSVVFEVHPRANKLEIMQAVESLFEVKVKAVRTVNCYRRARRVGLHMSRPEVVKKAYVSLAEGSSIDVIEGL